MLAHLRSRAPAYLVDAALAVPAAGDGLGLHRRVPRVDEPYDHRILTRRSRRAHGTGRGAALGSAQSTKGPEMAGEIVHVEFMAEDVDRAQRFWSGLFGWKFGDSGMPEMDYRMAQTGPDSGAAPVCVGRPRSPEVLLRHRRHRRLERAGARARRHGGGQDPRPDARLVRGLRRQRGQRVPPLAGGLLRPPQRSRGRLHVATPCAGPLARSIAARWVLMPAGLGDTAEVPPAEGSADCEPGARRADRPT